MSGSTTSQAQSTDGQGQQTPNPGTAAEQAARAQAAASTAPSASGRSGQQFTPPESQEEFDRIVGDRLARERAKFADYDELKAKAAKFDEAEAASKSEAERLADELAKATERNQTLEAQAVRGRVAAETGLPLELITASTEDECRAQAEAAKKFLAEQSKSGPSWGRQIGSGSGSAPQSADPIRQLIDAKQR